MSDGCRVGVIGLGYIGLPTAAIVASAGFDVTGIDVRADVVDTVNRGDIHIIEPDLAGYVRDVVSKGNLRASVTVPECDVYLICVPTPVDMSSGRPLPDLSFIDAVTDSLIKVLRAGALVILESTSPVGTTDRLRERLEAAGIDTSKIDLAYCPERVLPGNVIVELQSNARVVGGLSESATVAAMNFYKHFVKGEILGTTARTAEMVKLTENSYRDVNIAFANELSLVCQNLGVNVWELIRLANHHPRVSILQPGTGVGGHCIAVDPWFLVSSDPENTQLIQTSRGINDNKPLWVAEQIESEARRMNTKRVFCLGLSFKPDIDDLRESPSLTVVNILHAKALEVACIEPNIERHNGVELVSIQEAMMLDEPYVVAVLVGHSQFKDPTVRDWLRSVRSLDFCGVTEP